MSGNNRGDLWHLNALTTLTPSEVAARTPLNPPPPRGNTGPATPQPDPDGWREHAACRDHPPAMFYPGSGEPTEPAKAICAGCPVRHECLEDALTPPVEVFGIWGGLTEKERRRIRSARHHARRRGAA